MTPQKRLKLEKYKSKESKTTEEEKTSSSVGDPLYNPLEKIERQIKKLLRKGKHFLSIRGKEFPLVNPLSFSLSFNFFFFPPPFREEKKVKNHWKNYSIPQYIATLSF